MTDVIFIGNPGTGKSTMLSCISGLSFRSGVSFGGGLTSMLKFQPESTSAEIRYGDTPGLQDVDMQEEAANAIEKALKSCNAAGRKAILIFVVTLEAGRVRPADVLTIKSVMSSFKLPNGQKPENNSYGVLINKFPQAELKNPNFFKPGGNREKVEKPFRFSTDPEDVTTDVIGYNPFTTDLHEQNNATMVNTNIIEALKKFLFDTCPRIHIGEVDGITVRSKSEMEATIAALQESIAELSARQVPQNPQNGFWQNIGEGALSGLALGPLGMAGGAIGGLLKSIF
jgi:energy-coupling factor transporter ATP-binding protein EcfA2